MSIKKIQKIIQPPPVRLVGDGFRVHNFIPSKSLTMQRMNPFILLDYNSTFRFPPSKKPKGVGVHPHKGFETVTIAYKGRVQHGDSSGGGGIIKEGDVQWMTAASGILHREFHETEWSKKGGEFQMIQLWVNLPAKYKRNKPKYQSIKNEEINRHKLENKQGIIEVIAGEYKGVKGNASTFTPMHLYNLKAQKGAKSTFQFPANYNTFLIVLEGKIRVNNAQNIQTDHMVLFDNLGEDIIIDVLENAVVFIASGEPIKEPIVHHGPFVMNTQAEIRQAMDDFNKGKFGRLK